MRFADLVRIVFRNLNRVRVRTLLTTLGVVIGVAAIVTLLSIAFGFEASVTGQLEGMGDTNQITMRQPRFGPGMMRGGGRAPVSETYILDDDVVQEIEDLEGVSLVVPTVSASGSIEVGRYTTQTSMTGIDTDQGEELGIEMADGRFMRRNDRDVIVVGYGMDSVFREKKTQKTVEHLDILGKKAEIIVERLNSEGETETRSFRVRIVGIMEEGGTDSDYQVYVPLKLAVEIDEWREDQPGLLKEEGYDSLIVVATDSSVVTDLVEKIEEMGYQAFSFKQMLEEMSQVFVILQIVLIGIGAIALIVAALGIINTMLMSIIERTREIGIMKVIGASNADITRIFLMEALAIGFLGGIGGLVLGYVVSLIIDLVAGAYYLEGTSTQSIVVLPLWLVGFALGFAMLVGLVSGVYPAGKAAGLSPVEALRHQ